MLLRRTDPWVSHRPVQYIPCRSRDLSWQCQQCAGCYCHCLACYCHLCTCYCDAYCACVCACGHTHRGIQAGVNASTGTLCMLLLLLLLLEILNMALPCCDGHPKCCVLVSIHARIHTWRRVCMRTWVLIHAGHLCNGHAVAGLMCMLKSDHD